MAIICVMDECVPVDDFDCLGDTDARIVLDQTSSNLAK